MLRATSGTFKLAIQFNDWVRAGTQLSACVRRCRLTCGPAAVPALLAAPEGGIGRRGSRDLFAERNRGEVLPDGANREGRQQPHGRHQVRVPVRCRAVWSHAAHLCRAAGRKENGGQDRRCAAARRGWLHRGHRSRERHEHRRRSLHRLLRLSRPVDRGSDEERIRGLAGMAGLAIARSRSGALRLTDAALHAGQRAAGRLAVADTAAASYRQWSRLLQRIHERRRSCCDSPRLSRRRAAGGSAAARASLRAYGGRSGRAIAWPSACPPAFSSRWNRRRSI